MGGLASLLSNHLMLSIVNHGIVSFPKIRKSERPFVILRNPVPKLLATLNTSITDKVGNYLACPTAQRDPNPTLEIFAINK